jgi:hypothetical protein
MITHVLRAATALTVSALAVTLMPLLASGETIGAGPDVELCAAINALQPGDELVLQPGNYYGPCVIRSSGVPRNPIVIRASDPEARPRIVYGGTSANVFEIRASDLVIRGLEFGPTKEGVDGVKILSGGRITVESCRFSEMAGIAVVANSASVRGITVRRNVILNSTATAMYFGCHDGGRCTVSDLVVEGNFIQQVTAPGTQVGYGLQVKLNSSAIIRDNVIAQTKGPGIMVYGSQDLLAVSVVERNVTIASRRSSGIVVGGGPAIVRNNVSAGNGESGIRLQNYGKRGLLRGVVIANNTVYNNEEGGISTSEIGVQDAILVNNAAHGRSGAPALPPPRSGVRLVANVDCSLALCFTNPDALNFSPFLGSALLGAGVIGVGNGIPREDLFGVLRRIPLTVGAIDRPSGPILLTPKP